MRAAGTAPSRRITGRAPVQSTTVEGGPPRAGPPSRIEVDALPELGEDLGRVARLGQAGDIGRGRRQRPDGRARAPGARHGPGRAGRSSGSRRSARRATATSGRCGTTTVSPPGQHASASAVAAGPITPIEAAWAAASSSSMIPRSGGRRLTRNRRSMPPGVVERDGDPVDRVGRQGDDAAARAGPRSPRRDPPRRRRRVRALMPRPRPRPGSETDPAVRAAVARVASSASRTAAAGAAAGGARTSASIIRATPSSASGGAM